MNGYSKVQGRLAELRDDGLSIQTTNFYLQAFKQLCRWMVRDGRAAESPVVHLQGGNVRLDRRHDRRALADDELRRLLRAARYGPTRYGMTGLERYWLCRLAVETGLRSSEMRSLTWTSFDLEAQPPTVSVQAAYSKRRRLDVLPLKRSTARSLQSWRATIAADGAGTPVFNNLPDKPAKMLRADLAGPAHIKPLVP